MTAELTGPMQNPPVFQIKPASMDTSLCGHFSYLCSPLHVTGSGQSANGERFASRTTCEGNGAIQTKCAEKTINALNQLVIPKLPVKFLCVLNKQSVLFILGLV